ncbi:response regulator [Corallibacter vietnamensis]|uniref:Response regulator n=1 Tax=Corallibacter vietnamensis TaxID=904130 RepID=A0ABP7H4L7_9FLAO
MNKQIAIIDDNLLFRKLTKILVKNSGIQESNIHLFSNGKEAFEFIYSNINNVKFLPEILFLDLNMPIMNGWKFLKLLYNLLENSNYKPVIYILTSSIDTKDIETANNIPFVKDYLVKPISKATIHKVLHTNVEAY